jgi:MFS superfamily sulfate permease-like transporter
MKTTGSSSRRRIVFESLRGFAPAWLPNDVVAGIMLAAIAIPEQIATARLAGMPPESGLYAFAAGSLAFAVFGANRYLSVGADSTITPIFAGAIAALALSGGASYPSLVVVAALLTGAALIVAGLLRAGWVADLLSIPVTTGFLAGISLHIVIGQLPPVLGVPDSSGPLLLRLAALLRNVPHANGVTLLIGAGVLALTIGAERISARIPGALIGLIVAGIAVATLHLTDRGVAVLGALPATLPQLRFTVVDLHNALQLAPIAMIVALVCMVQTAVVLRSYPNDPEALEDPSRDFAAVGAGSIASALLGSFAVDASPPRTAVAASSGGRSQLAGIVAVVAVALLAVFGAHLAAYLPLAALGGVLIFIGMRIFRIGDMMRIARIGGDEIWLVVAGALLVVVFPIEIGMLLAIGLSLVHGLYIIARPPSTELVRVPKTTIWWPPDAKTSERIAGVVVFSPAAPITFTNGHYIVARLRALVAAAPSPVGIIVIEGSGIIDVDYTGASLLCAAIGDFRASGVTVAIARLEDERARAAAERTGLVDTVGPGRVYDSVYEALRALDPSAVADTS